ncbi:hypothetical protein ACVGXT_00745, partial [Enterobacter intestinihominis]
MRMVIFFIFNWFGRGLFVYYGVVFFFESRPVFFSGRVQPNTRAQYQPPAADKADRPTGLFPCLRMRIKPC